VHQNQPGAVPRLVHSVAGDDQGLSAVGMRGELFPQFGTQQWIQPDRRFVEDEQVRIADEGACERPCCPPEDRFPAGANLVAAKPTASITSRTRPEPTPYIAVGLDEIVAGARRRAGIAHLTCHELRHTA
jgi:hypothetical protein